MPDQTLVSELRAAGPLVSAGAFAGDFANLGGAVTALENGGARLIHLDVGDGRYSPLMVGGPAEVAAVRTKALKDVHLMIEEPLAHLPHFAEAGADAITLHLDAGRHPLQALRTIGGLPNASDPGRPILRGACLALDQPISILEPILGELDLVLVLAVVSGYRAPMAPDTAERVAAVRSLVDDAGLDVLVSVDGSIPVAAAPTLAAAGADVIVSGSALFADGHPSQTLRELSAAVAA